MMLLFQNLFSLEIGLLTGTLTCELEDVILGPSI